MRDLLLKIPAIRNFVFERGVKREIAEGEYRPTIAPTHILDLGAHKGFATFWFATQYPNAVIHAYEPNPKLFPILRDNTKNFRNVKIFQEAIAPTDGTIRFYLSDNYLSSSVFGSGQAVSLQAISLATAVQRIQGEHIFLKIDIEGAEFDVLKDIPPQVEEIIGEAHPKKAKRSNDEVRAALARFSKVDIQDGTCIFRAV